MGAEDGGGRDPGADPYQAGAVKESCAVDRCPLRCSASDFGKGRFPAFAGPPAEYKSRCKGPGGQLPSALTGKQAGARSRVSPFPVSDNGPALPRGPTGQTLRERSPDDETEPVFPPCLHAGAAGRGRRLPCGPGAPPWRRASPGGGADHPGRSGLEIPEPEGRPEVAPHLCGSDDGGGHDPENPDDTDDCHLEELVVCPFEGMIKDGKGGCRCPEWQKLGPDGCEDKGGDSGGETGETGEGSGEGSGNGEGNNGNNGEDDDKKFSVNPDCDAVAVRGLALSCHAKVSGAEGTIRYEWLFEPDSGGARIWPRGPRESLSDVEMEESTTDDTRSWKGVAAASGKVTLSVQDSVHPTVKDSADVRVFGRGWRSIGQLIQLDSGAYLQTDFRPGTALLLGANASAGGSLHFDDIFEGDSTANDPTSAVLDQIMEGPNRGYWYVVDHDYRVDRRWHINKRLDSLKGP